ncbi:MAG: DUF2461 domain-containing protein [Gammaproteobacteria bacterium]|nr:DUF2461 domain-containing protein [Gammaproteobacteria bacterium]
MHRFTGFPPTTLAFLRELRANNNKPWFAAHHEEYQASYVEPAKQFVLAAGERLRQFAPDVEAQPRILGSIFRINRDTRFSKDKTPYKDHLDLWFWEGERREAVSGFFVRFTPEIVAVGAGCHGFAKQHLADFRHALGTDASGLKLAGIVKALEKHGYQVGGRRYKRAPRGYSVGCEALEPLLLHDAMFVHCEEPADDALLSAEVVHNCVRHWSAFAPLHQWLMRNVQNVRTGA